MSADQVGDKWGKDLAANFFITMLLLTAEG